MEWNDTMQKSIPFHDFGMEWWDDFNLIIPFQYFPNVIHSSNYYKIDYHSFVKQESTEFTALTNKKSVWIWWTQACCLFPKNMICCLLWEKGWDYCLVGWMLMLISIGVTRHVIINHSDQGFSALRFLDLRFGDVLIGNASWTPYIMGSALPWFVS